MARRQPELLSSHPDGRPPQATSEAVAAYRAEDVRGLHTQRESPCPVVMAWLCHLGMLRRDNRNRDSG